jgi:tRNA(Ile)-lysidine synthase
MANPVSQRIANTMLQTIRRHDMLRAGDAAGVAVSGGADSVALLLLLEELRAQIGVRLVVLHFNHELRGAEADEDERFVADLARTRGLEMIAGRGNVAARARETHANIEEAARNLRHEFFAGLVAARRVTCVTVAHTADDQVETVLAKMIRGTGPAGLAGIYPVAGDVVRPLMDVRRADLRELLQERGQVWREDSTNADESRLRARIRARLLPALERDFQPAIVARIGQLAALARQDELFWHAFVEDRFRALARYDGDSIRIAVTDLLKPTDLDPGNAGATPAAAALTTRIVRRILQELKGDRLGFTSRHIEDVLHLATASASGHRICMPSGIVVERVFGELRFRKAGRAQITGAHHPAWEAEFLPELWSGISSDFAIDIPDIKLRLRLKVIDWPCAPSETKQQAVADWNQLCAPVVLRNWRPGDAFRPQGRLRPHKLKNLLRDRRIALHERCHWPVLTSAGQLIWARGFPVAHGFLASGVTKKALVISEEPF